MHWFESPTKYHLHKETPPREGARLNKKMKHIDLGDESSEGGDDFSEGGDDVPADADDTHVNWGWLWGDEENKESEMGMKMMMEMMV